MFLYDTNAGLKIPSHIKNNSPNFPIVKLQENAAQGFGFFTSKGVDGSSLDTNVSHADAEKYLRNLPSQKRSKGYVAVLLGVDVAEVGGPFVQSSDPAVYIYKGAVDAQGNVTDAEWRTDSNWMLIQGGSSGSGNIEQNLEGVAQQTTSSINFVDVANVTNVTFTDTPGTSTTDNAFQFDIATDFARVDQNFYIGNKANAFATSSSIDAAEGVAIQAAGAMVFKKAGVAGDTNISGGNVSLANLNASADIETSGGVVRAGTFNSQNSTMTSSQLTTDTVNANVKIETPKIQADGQGDIKFYVPTSLEPAFVVATSDDFIPEGASTTGSDGLSQVYTNGELRILHAPEDTQLEYLYGVGANGKVVKIERGLVASGASSFQAGFGITITNADTDNPGLQVNPGDVVTIATNQTIPATKEIGQIVLTGNISASESDVDGLRFNEGAIDNIADQSETADNINLLYVINNQSSNRHGTVYRGVSGASFLDAHTSFDDNFRVTNTVSTNNLNINIKDVYVKSTANDASMFDLRSKRLGVHSFTPSEISAELTEHGNTTGVVGQQAAVADGATIIEWVREFGDYVNGNAADITTRRNSGVIMKAGFTAATNPYTAQGILDSKFRFSAKQAAVAESTDPSEELAGTVTFTVDATDTTYAAQNSAYAIQIGTQSTSAAVGDRLNEVSIPNLLVKSLNVPNDGSSYIGGGGTFGGNWNFNGDLTVSGVLTATNGDNSLGSTSTGTLATTASLLQLGSPSATTPNDFNEREIGIVGLFNYDGDLDGNVDNNEAMATSFFRDFSESGVAEIFGRSGSSINATTNHHRPWKLMTSVEKVNTLGTSIDTDDDFFPTALEVGGIRLKGYDPANPTNYSTKFFNRVVTDISAVATAEAGSAHAWEGGGGAGALTGALASAKAIKDYVDNEISGVGGFSSTPLALGTINFGVTNSNDPVSATNSYTSAQADRIFIEDTGSSGAVAAALPEDLGLALHEDSTESVGNLNRPDVGWLPGATPLGKGTALRAIVNKVFTAPSLPEITEYDTDSNVFKTAVSLFERYPTSLSDMNGAVYLENGFDDFGDNSQDNSASNFTNVEGVNVRITNFSGVDELRHIITIPTGVTLTDTDGGTVVSSNVPLVVGGVALSAANADIIVSLNPVVESDSSVTSLYYLDLAADGSLSADKAFKNDGQIELSATKSQSVIETKIQITSLTDEFAGFTSPNPVESFNYYIRRRSFMFVSNLDVRESMKGPSGTSIVDDGLDFTIPSVFATMDGTTAASQTNSSYSNKFMHYLIATATSDTSDVLDSGDIAEDPAGADITFAAGTYGLFGRNSSGSLEQITQVKIRNVIVGAAGGAANTPLSSSSVTHIPFVSGAPNIQKYPGMLADIKGAVGNSQYWPKSTATTSSDGFLYRAVPISFAGAGVASSWLNGADALFQVDAALGTTDDLVRDNNGNLLTFTMTNQYGVDTEYVLFQSGQTLDSESAVGKFGDIVEV